ncbi:RrF2 family transcriptional regulator [Candidatus Omnitrophota bacterium]
MRISARCDYACRALLELSLHWPDKTPVHIKQISKNQEIPERYLVQILIQLKRIGLVTSSRGKGGGYNLAKAPEDIRLGEVMRAISGNLLPISDSALRNGSVFVGIWKEVEGVMEDILGKVSFADISRKLTQKERVVMYQI